MEGAAIMPSSRARATPPRPAARHRSWHRWPRYPGCVPEDVGDLLEWPALPQQPAGQAVAKGMDTRTGPAASAIGLLDGPPHDASPDRLAVGRDVADEH